MTGISQNEINQWMVNTISYATVCQGTDDTETDESAIHQIAKGIAESISKPTIQNITIAVLQKAHEIMGPENDCHNEAIEDHYHANVIKWVLMTIKAVWTSKNRHFTNESLEADAENKIMNRIRGNRRTLPNRHDLDLIVRRTIEWGLKELGVAVEAEV